MPQELSKIPAVDGAQIRNGAGPAKERAKKSKSRSIVMAGLDPIGAKISGSYTDIYAFAWAVREDDAGVWLSPGAIRRTRAEA
jgi:hypothetical protein